MDLKKQRKGILLVIISAVFWGMSGSTAQFLFHNENLNMQWLVAVRLLTAGSIFLIYTFFKIKDGIWKIWKHGRDGLNLVFFGIFGMLGIQYTYFATIKYSNAPTATIMQCLAPVLITCYLTIKFRKFPSLREITAVMLAILGTFLIITKGNIHSLSISKTALFWGILSAFAAAFYTVQPCHLIQKWGSTLVIGWGMLIGGILFSLLVHNPFDFTGKACLYSILGIIFIILFGTIIGFYCYLESLKYISPTTASVLDCVEPLTAAFLSIVWLHVSFGIEEWTGTILIIATIIILSKKQKVS